MQAAAAQGFHVPSWQEAFRSAQVPSTKGNGNADLPEPDGIVLRTAESESRRRGTCPHKLVVLGSEIDGQRGLLSVVVQRAMGTTGLAAAARAPAGRRDHAGGCAQACAPAPTPWHVG